MGFGTPSSHSDESLGYCQTTLRVEILPADGTSLSKAAGGTSLSEAAGGTSLSEAKGVVQRPATPFASLRDVPPNAES